MLLYVFFSRVSYCSDSIGPVNKVSICHLLSLSSTRGQGHISDLFSSLSCLVSYLSTILRQRQIRAPGNENSCNGHRSPTKSWTCHWFPYTERLAMFFSSIFLIPWIGIRWLNGLQDDPLMVTILVPPWTTFLISAISSNQNCADQISQCE